MHRKCLFFGKFEELCFLETPVLRFALFALLSTNTVSNSFSIDVTLSCISNKITKMNNCSNLLRVFSAIAFFIILSLWLTTALKMYSLSKKVFQLNIFATCFVWSWFFLISEWFPTIKIREAVISAKCFRKKFDKSEPFLKGVCI